MKNILLLLLMSGCSLSKTNEIESSKIRELTIENKLLSQDRERSQLFELKMRTYSDNIQSSINKLQKENFELKSYIQFKLNSIKEYNEFKDN